MSEPILAVDGLHAFYGAAQVLFGVSLTVSRGEVMALVGRNGAGKSTTIRALIGLEVRRTGRIVLEGRDIAELKTHEIARLGIGYVPEERRIFGEMSVDENLEVGRRPGRDGRAAWTAERLFDLFPNLAAMRKRRGAEMSGGEQQMLSIARTLMGNPSVILLDEPAEGLAPLIVDEMAEAILVMKGEGLAVLVSDQNLRFAGRIADRATVLEKGAVRYSGTMAALDADGGVGERYLAI